MPNAAHVAEPVGPCSTREPFTQRWSSYRGFASALFLVACDDPPQEASPNEIQEKLTQVDGEGSGVDADLLDGRDATAFADVDHTHANASVSSDGFLSAADKGKLDGIEDGANNYTHPATHSASEIAGGVLDVEFVMAGPSITVVARRVVSVLNMP